MQVVLHTGAHSTDEDLIYQCLDKNRDFLTERGVSLPRPRRYRRQLRDLLQNMTKGPVDPTEIEVLMHGITTVQQPDRLILSNYNLFAMPKWAIRNNRFYPRAGDRIADFISLFPGAEIELFMALRDPATFLPSLLAISQAETLEELTADSLPMALRWSEVVGRIIEAAPGANLTIWCNEDTPLIWEQLLREFAGVDPTVQLDGHEDLLAGIMSDEGMRRYHAYLASHPGMTEVQRRRVIAAFLDKFAIEEAVEEELDLPGWTEDFIAAMSEAYDEDIYEIQRMPGVTVITP